MIFQFIYALKNINYQLFAKHKKGHGIHSPFIYDLVKNVFNNKEKDSDLSKIIELHKKLRNSKKVLQYNELGAGSSYKAANRLKLGQIIKRSSVNPKYGSLLYNLIKYYNLTDILELGTSVGISTAYIAQANPDSVFRSIEGIEEKIKTAKKTASELRQHTELIHGDFDTILPSCVEKFDKLDFVFFDGNHKKDSTIEYFENCLRKIHNESIFIFDDIHWSAEMEEAWDTIKNNPRVKVSVDLFRMGLIFFRKELSKQHYIIKF